MTGSNGYVWPTEPPQGPEWVTFPDARDYQASHRGKVRSFKRDPEGRVMKPHVDADDYRRFNYTDDNGVRHTNVHVARAVLLAHDPGGYRPGLHACHGRGGPGDNRYPENIRWDDPGANREEALAVRLENTPLKPPKVCPRCGAEHRERGKNCRACFAGIGVRFTQLLIDGMPPEDAAEQVGYPLNGALNLALRYGGLRFYREGERRLPRIVPLEPHAVGYRQSHPGRLRRVLFGRRASRRNSDGA